MPTNSTFILLGLGREGFSSYQYLRSQHPDAFFLAYDDKDVLINSENWIKIAKNDKKIAFFYEKDVLLQAIKHNADEKPSAAIAVLKSPGIPPGHQLVNALMAPAWRSRLHWTSNTSLFFEQLRAMRKKHAEHTLVTVGVTGTKGKSTTTSLIHHLLSTSGFPTLLGGNIGRPPLDLLDELEQLLASADANRPIFVVLELSSHQLADLSESPQIAVIQEIVPEHLDYYPSFESYVDAKSHISRYQAAEDLVIYNSDYALPTNLADMSAGRHRTFTSASCADEVGHIIPLDQLPLKGAHNLLNIMPSILIAREYHLSTAVIREALHSFKPLPHRMELVATTDGIAYYNDSLSTTPEAAVAAIKSFQPGTVILLAGGYDRQLDYTPLGKAIIDQHVKGVILFPTTGERIRAAIEHAAQASGATSPTLVAAATMAEAVEKARSVATQGDVILLSPASASFNMYRDYQERGEAFRSEIHIHART